MHAACQGVSLAACTITLPRFKLEVLADSVHHFVMSVSSICICRMPSLSPTLTTGPSPSDPTTSARTDCPETSQRMSTAWWLEGNIYLQCNLWTPTLESNMWFSQHLTLDISKTFIKIKYLLLCIFLNYLLAYC